MRNTKQAISGQWSIVTGKQRLPIADGKMLAQAIGKHEDEGKRDARRR
jgi:hypothetical protein